MVSGVFNLYKNINRYDKTVVTNLKKINDELLQVVTEDRNFPLNLEESRGYQLSIAMLGVLETYNQIAFLTETALQNLRLKLMQIRRDSPSENYKAKNTLHPEDTFGPYAETLNSFENVSSKTLNDIIPKKLPQEAESLEEGFQNILQLSSAPKVENKTRSVSKPQTSKIQYAPTELFKFNPCGLRTGHIQSKDKSKKWKAVPALLLKKYKEKHAIYGKNEQLETLREEKEKEVSTQAAKSIYPEDGAINDKTLTHKQMDELPTLSNGDTISILVTGYKTTCHFYAQFFGKYSYQFSELMGQLNSSCMVDTYTPFKGYPEIGQLLLTKHNTSWYRARCLSKEFGQIKVFLVDVGITVMKKMADIAQMTDDFLRFPFYAFECVLEGVCERREILPEKSLKVFEKVMLQKRFTALVVENGIPVRLQMYDGKGLDMRYVLEMYGIV